MSDDSDEDKWGDRIGGLKDDLPQPLGLIFQQRVPISQHQDRRNAEDKAFVDKGQSMQISTSMLLRRPNAR